MRFLQDDIEVPCIMQWRLLWYSAQCHLKNVGVLQACHDQTIKKAIETAFTCQIEERHMPRSAFMEAHHMMMVHHKHGWALRPERSMNGWNLGGPPDALSENKGDDLMHFSSVSP